jgi:hypothetical protein
MEWQALNYLPLCTFAMKKWLGLAAGADNQRPANQQPVN